MLWATQSNLVSSGDELEVFLPMTSDGIAVLVHIDGNSWRVDNTVLQADTLGLSYHLSKQLHDTLNIVAKWGMFVQGTDTGDGWLRTQVQSVRAHIVQIKAKASFPKIAKMKIIECHLYPTSSANKT